jgi:hypothetical protein
MAHGDRLANLPDRTPGSLARHSPAESGPPHGLGTVQINWADLRARTSGHRLRCVVIPVIADRPESDDDGQLPVTSSQAVAESHTRGPVRPGRPPLLQPRVDRFGLKGEHAEHALVYPPQRLAPGHPVQALKAEGVLAQRQRPLLAHRTGAQPRQVPRLGVVGAVDDPRARVPGRYLPGGQPPVPVPPGDPPA